MNLNKQINKELKKESWGYQQEDQVMKFLKENSRKYLTEISREDIVNELNVELVNLNPKVLRIDYVVKSKDLITAYEFLSTKNNIKDVLWRIFLYLARLGFEYKSKVNMKLVITPDVDKDKIVHEYSPGQFFRPEIVSFKDYDGDKLLSNISYKVKNNLKLTYNESLVLGVLPLMRTKQGIETLIIKTINITREITDIDKELKESILGMLVMLADKYIEDQKLKNSIIDVVRMEVTIFKDYVDSHKDGWYEEGRHDGMEIGTEKGIGIGTENKGLEIAQTMLESDYPLEEIERITKLDQETIMGLNGGK